jgi:hypothetical protein
MTPQGKPDFFLLAHSHGLSLLDGISNWRERATVKTAETDTRYGAALQGWLTGSLSAEPFETEVGALGLPFKQVEAWLISPKSGIGDLAKIQHNDGADTVVVNEKLAAILAGWNSKVPIVSMLNGNEHALIMLNRFPAYDFVDIDLTNFQPGVPVIDTAFIDDVISGWINAVFPALLTVRHMTENPLIHVLPPPPRENPERSRHFEVLNELVAAFGFLPEQVRLKWYRRYCRKLSAQLASVGIIVLPPPNDACTIDGLLKEEFAEGITHGNAAYGRLVAEQLSILLETL